MYVFTARGAFRSRLWLPQLWSRLTKVIHTTLTLNSTTLYTTENVQLLHSVSNLNCLELISLELGLINASKTLIGSIPLTTSAAVTNTSLLLYFMKKTTSNVDGSSDLITVITVTHMDVNKTLILSVLKKIIDKYIQFRQELESSDADPQAKSKLGEFKLYMNQIIKFEELHYDSNQRIYNYGAINRDDDSEETERVINPNQLVLANEEVGEVRLLMLDNINKLMSRGDKINLLVDQTDRLTTSSLMFNKKAQQIKRKVWLSKTKFILLLAGGAMAMLYLFLGAECGFPLFDSCIKG